METVSFRLSNGMMIPAVGFGVGTVKDLRARGSLYIAREFALEKAKDLFVNHYKENNRYPILKDIKKEKMIPQMIQAKLQSVWGGVKSCLIRHGHIAIVRKFWAMKCENVALAGIIFSL